MPIHNENNISRKEFLDWGLRGTLAALIIICGGIGYQGQQVLSEMKDHDERIRNNTNAITRLNQADTDTQRRLAEMDKKLDLIIDRLP